MNASQLAQYFDHTLLRADAKIGRASCRERVLVTV